MDEIMRNFACRKFGINMALGGTSWLRTGTIPRWLIIINFVNRRPQTEKVE